MRISFGDNLYSEELSRYFLHVPGTIIEMVMIRANRNAPTKKKEDAFDQRNLG